KNPSYCNTFWAEDNGAFPDYVPPKARNHVRYP
ncbi:MAG: hypothetical protein JWN34_4477, partial [Bryobacterales bacterium]|nr:hypothetical protein [Bryobacterales bacterium]